jgi:hypothetical protein
VVGSVCITKKQFENTVNEINMLSRGDALRAQSLLQGFVIANEKQLDYSKIDNNQLVAMLYKLGGGQE